MSTALEGYPNISRETAEQLNELFGQYSPRRIAAALDEIIEQAMFRSRVGEELAGPDAQDVYPAWAIRKALNRCPLQGDDLHIRRAS